MASDLKMKTSKKTILITGALGHIGSKLIRSLDEGLVRRAILLDNLESQRYPSLFDLPKKISYEFIHADARKFNFNKFFSAKVGKEKVDAVVHLAAITDAESSFKKSKKVESVNFGSLKKIANACQKNGIRLFFPSTTSVYGSQESRVDENCEDLRPQSPYANSKLAAEKYLFELRGKGLKFVICRFGTIFNFSPGMRFHTAVNKFTWQAINNLPITVWKTAWKQRRPYLDLEDCVGAVNFIFEKDLFNGEIYNVITKNYTVEDIVTSIKEFAPNLAVAYVDSPIMNQLSYDVDDSKFKKTGFQVRGDLKKSLNKVFSKFSGILRSRV